RSVMAPGLPQQCAPLIVSGQPEGGGLSAGTYAGPFAAPSCSRTRTPREDARTISGSGSSSTFATCGAPRRRDARIVGEGGSHHGGRQEHAGVPVARTVRAAPRPDARGGGDRAAIGPRVRAAGPSVREEGGTGGGASRDGRAGRGGPGHRPRCRSPCPHRG